MDLLVIYHLYRSVILKFVLLVYQQQKDVAALVELYDQYKLEIDLMKQALERNNSLFQELKTILQKQ